MIFGEDIKQSTILRMLSSLLLPSLLPSFLIPSLLAKTQNPHCFSLTFGKNRIYHRSPMQTKNSQAEDTRIVPETRFTEFPALSADLSAGISQTDV